MVTYFVVERVKGTNWDQSLEMRKQEKWSEHVDFMNSLETDGFVVLGGPLSAIDIADNDHFQSVLLIIEASNEEFIRNLLSGDPWSQLGLLEINHIKKWEILLNRQSPDR